MQIKIYFNDKPLYLVSALDAELEALSHHSETVLMDELSNAGINSLLHEMRANQIHAGIFMHPDIDKAKKAIWKKFTIIQAAGGIVLNEKKQLLFIFRRGKWDLPKGKLDTGESIEQCAVRETEEETGLKDVVVTDHLLTTFHTYDENGKHILKETYWYLMNVGGEQNPEPQLEEQITALEWADRDNLQKYVANTYPSILEVLKAGDFPL
ncbi:MAG: NUDIX hydrolase [Chitinophagaceae bacterium]|nr:NUDIX hydrolase [Chitinophagaceae bacterium]